MHDLRWQINFGLHWLIIVSCRIYCNWLVFIEWWGALTSISLSVIDMLALTQDGVQLSDFQWLMTVYIKRWKCSIAFAVAYNCWHRVMTVFYCICCVRLLNWMMTCFLAICSGWWQLSTIAIWKSECTNPTTGGETKEENISWFCIQFGKLDR